MPKYCVELADGRTLHIHSDSEDAALKQANFAETSRIVIATLRNLPINPYASPAVSITKVKD